MKTIKELNEKMWYRAIKSFYILTNIGILIGILIWFFDYNEKNDFIFGFIWLIIFEISRRVFYYIVLGAINPKKE